MEVKTPLNFINIQMLPAKNGDCILVKIQAEKEYNILIDAGYESTFEESLKTQLQAIEELDLCIITHIDNDHIGGAIPLFEQNGNANNPKIVKINDVWHNSFRHVHHSTAQQQLSKEEKRQLYSIAKQANTYIEKPQQKETNISAEQGSTLAALLLKNEYNWNGATNEKAISMENLPVFSLGKQIKLTLLSPDNKRLQALEKYWKEELIDMGFKSKNFIGDLLFDDAVEFLSRLSDNEKVDEEEITQSNAIETILLDAKAKKYRKDNSAKNGSSIAFMLDFQEKRILFTGDTFSETIEQNLRAFFPNQETIYFDALKISHHGSKANNSPSFLNLIDTPIYLISSDGTAHGHPDIETLAHIILKPTNYTKQLIFNYSTSVSEKIDTIALKQKYNYEVNYSNNITI
jgi:beta-lactamase superfamily II metal-dependent hydrolase